MTISQTQIRTFYVRHRHPGPGCTDYVIERIKGEHPLDGNIGQVMGMQQLSNMVANGNRIVMVPSRQESAVMDDGTWREAQP